MRDAGGGNVVAWVRLKPRLRACGPRRPTSRPGPTATHAPMSAGWRCKRFQSDWLPDSEIGGIRREVRDAAPIGRPQERGGVSDRGCDPSQSREGEGQRVSAICDVVYGYCLVGGWLVRAATRWRRDGGEIMSIGPPGQRKRRLRGRPQRCGTFQQRVERLVAHEERGRIPLTALAGRNRRYGSPSWRGQGRRARRRWG